jgi:hypothetical protein
MGFGEREVRAALDKLLKEADRESSCELTLRCALQVLTERRFERASSGEARTADTRIFKRGAEGRNGSESVAKNEVGQGRVAHG